MLCFVHCRRFVGFRYGMILGMSMHKGYAFVQYNSHEEAKRAAMSEDGKTYAGQTLGIPLFFL